MWDTIIEVAWSSIVFQDLLQNAGLMPLIWILLKSYLNLYQNQTLFGLLRKFNGGEYTVLLSSNLLRSDLYKSLERLQIDCSNFI